MSTTRNEALCATIAKLASVAACTQFACIRPALRVRETMLDPLAHHLGHEWMQSKRRRHKIANACMLAGGRGRESRDIIVPMPARQQEIGEHDHRPRPPGH